MTMLVTEFHAKASLKIKLLKPPIWAVQDAPAALAVSGISRPLHVRVNFCVCCAFFYVLHVLILGRV